MNRLAVSLFAALLLCAALPAAAAPGLSPVLHATDWLNASAPPQVDGKVVVVDVFTVDCFNCRNVVPALRELYASDRAKGLEIIGIHSPETPAEKQRGYVTENLRSQGIRWPVAVDNSFVLWNAYGVDAWPTQLFFDRHGHLRKTIVGDSQDDLVRSTVAALLAEK
jgi:thiol-disulfide isomerase/thioredoxin